MKTFQLTILFLFSFVLIANAVDFSFTGDDFIKAREVGEGEQLFYPVIHNNGQEEIKFNLIATPNIPEEWGWLFCAGGLCFPGDSGFVFVAPQSEEEIELHFYPHSFNGSGNIVIKVYPDGYPEEAQYLDFTYMENPIIILVDDDGGEDYETYYSDAINSLLGGTVSYGIWDRSVEGFDEEDLHYCSQIYWLTGTTTENTLTAEDRTRLADFMDNASGRLFVSGESIGSDIGDTDFYQNYLGATLVNSDTDQYHLLGLEGGAIGSGLDFNIFGGDGADNQTKPEAIACGEGAWGIFAYDSGDLGAIDHIIPIEESAAASVYFSFGFEAIDNAEDRNQIIQNMFFWFLGITSDIEDNTIDYVPTKFKLSQNYPNPFNPTTHIEFSIDSQSFVRLDIHNSAGQLIRTLVNGQKNSASYSVIWDGTNQNNQSVESGVYYYSLNIKTDGITKTETKKMILLK